MRKKIYGMSKKDVCPFCQNQATTTNEQGIPVCIKHKQAIFPDLKCACGDYLDLKKGKFGPYFNCMSCGNLSWAKVMDMYPNVLAGIKKEKESSSNNSSHSKSLYSSAQKTQKKARPRYNVVKKDNKETTITSDELDFM